LATETTREAQNRYFKTFIIGAIICVSGLCSLMLLEVYLPESSRREMLSLASLVVAGIGGIIAFKGYISLAIVRFRHFIKSK
jgi:hypothetical protein